MRNLWSRRISVTVTLTPLIWVVLLLGSWRVAQGAVAPSHERGLPSDRSVAFAAPALLQSVSSSPVTPEPITSSQPASEGGSKSDSTDALVKFFGVLAALVGLFTAIFSYMRARRPAITTPSGTRAGGVRGIEAPEPRKWATAKFPQEWSSVDFRKAFWTGRRRWARIGAIVMGALLLFFWIAFSVDLGGISGFWAIYLLLSIPYAYAAFHRLGSLAGEPWKRISLTRREATLRVGGSRDSVLESCLEALAAIGANIVSLDSDKGLIVASTGRDAWWYIPERVEIRVQSSGPHAHEITVSSDESAPMIDGPLKRNSSNVHRLVAQLSILAVAAPSPAQGSDDS